MGDLLTTVLRCNHAQELFLHGKVDAAREEYFEALGLSHHVQGAKDEMIIMWKALKNTELVLFAKGNN